MTGVLDHDIRSRFHRATEQEGYEILDAAARHYLKMSGAAFVTAWDAGAFADDPDRPEVMRIAMLLPFGR